MYILNDKVGEAELLIHKALNIIESIDLKDCFVKKAKYEAITKLEEALFWMRYEGRRSL